MAIICEKLKLIYVQVPATGCSVVSKVLSEEFNGKSLGRKHNDIPELLSSGTITKEELSDYTIAANIRNPYDRLVTYYQRMIGGWTEEYIAWSRRDLKRRLEKNELSKEEYDRAIAYRDRKDVIQRRRIRIIKTVGYNQWLPLTLSRWRIRDLNNTPDNNSLRFTNHLFPMLQHVQYTIRQEMLEKGLNDLLHELGVEKRIELPRKNITPGKKPYKEYYNKLSEWYLRRFYTNELSFFGYDIDGPISERSLIKLSELQTRQLI